jgi:hypothetical protein
MTFEHRGPLVYGGFSHTVSPVHDLLNPSSFAV